MLILLGWALGLLSPAVVEGIRRRRDSTAVRDALLSELRDLRYRVALASFRACSTYGDIDREYLVWLEAVLRSCPEIKADNSVLRLIEEHLALDDKAFKEFVRMSKEENPALGLKKYAVPLLDARLQSLWHLPLSFQRGLLAVRTHLNLLNEEIDQSRYYFGLTFTIDGDNHKRVVENFVGAQRNFAVQAKRIINEIQKLVPSDAG
ncbi:MAG: hypothetical protein JSS26_20100 [Nitrospira sp.]|nr:hypothetical protein [Nitrospira sp.]